MVDNPQARFKRRTTWLLAIIAAPLVYLLLFHGPIPQSKGYHLFADTRTCLGIVNFGNVASNLAFLLVGGCGCAWCYRNLKNDARLSWMTFFAGVTLVFFGSASYHYQPNDDTLVWDRLPMTLAFMGLFTALLIENLGEHPVTRLERPVLIPTLVLGIASVLWWRHTNDLRIYIWVQLAPLLAIPFVLAMFPARHTHRVYLLYGLGLYALAKVLEGFDESAYAFTAQGISGHTLKHLTAAMAPLMLLLMLQRR